MKIDVALKGDGLLFRFESDFVPRKGETISDPKTQETFIILQVDYLLHTAIVGDKRVNLVTIEVSKTK